MTRATWSAIGLALVLVIGIGGWALTREPSRAAPPAVKPSATPVAAPAPQQPMHGRLLKPKRGCAVSVNRPFAPTSISVAGVTRSSPVIATQRDANGTPGVPPISDTGKRQFAWDAPGVRPGEASGTVFLDAHTWPDGTALGNALLAGLHRGDTLMLRGQHHLLCYRVYERLEVAAEQAPVGRIYNHAGQAQLALVVCSGRRLGPGNWENRTIWFARPMA